MMTNGPGQQRGRKLAPIDFPRVKQEISILDVLKLMGWEPNARRQGGAELRGKCPVHGSKSETSKIFAVSPSKNAFNCFSCGAHGNQIDLAAHHFGIPADQSVKVIVALCRELGREIPRKP